MCNELRVQVQARLLNNPVPVAWSPLMGPKHMAHSKENLCTWSTTVITMAACRYLQLISITNTMFSTFSLLFISLSFSFFFFVFLVFVPFRKWGTVETRRRTANHRNNSTRSHNSTNITRNIASTQRRLAEPRWRWRYRRGTARDHERRRNKTKDGQTITGQCGNHLQWT